jgi:hypothetical protein
MNRYSCRAFRLSPSPRVEERDDISPFPCGQITDKQAFPCNAFPSVIVWKYRPFDHPI